MHFVSHHRIHAAVATGYLVQLSDRQIWRTNWSIKILRHRWNILTCILCFLLQLHNLLSYLLGHRHIQRNNLIVDLLTPVIGRDILQLVVGGYLIITKQLFFGFLDGLLLDYLVLLLMLSLNVSLHNYFVVLIGVIIV